MVAMGFFDSLFSSKRPEATHDVTFTLDQAGHTYEDGNVGLEPTSLTITPESKRVAVIGLNGSGKTTLLMAHCLRRPVRCVSTRMVLRMIRR